MAPKRVEVEIDGRTLSLSNLDKPMYPEAGFAKGHVIDYYTRVSPALLPHLRGRPLTLKRYPDGVEGPHFYEKQCPSHRPPWVRTVAADSSRARGGKIDFCLADDLPTLVWLANLADLELHTSLATAADYSRPTVRRLRPRPGRAGHDRRVRRGRAGAAHGLRAPGDAGVPEDLRLEGHAGLRALEHAG